jgi:hypothetical protein
MAKVAKKWQDELVRMKRCVEQGYDNFKDNIDRYQDFTSLAFYSTLTDGEKSVLSALKKPPLEFNIVESLISRLMGEFFNQEPSIQVMPDDGAHVTDDTIETVEGYVRHILCDANKNGMEYDVYGDTLGGGYSVIKVWTEYANSKGFNQIIKVGRVFDPCLCGFDPLARLPHKGDARFCYENYPLSKEEVKQRYPHLDLDQVKFVRKSTGFNWSYKAGSKEIVMLCDFYEKKSKKVQLVKLSDGQELTRDEYEALAMNWTDPLIPIPIIIDERTATIDIVHRTVFIENEVLEHTETDFSYLPLVFVDGNSKTIRKGKEQIFTQVTRPYIYNAKGVQKLKNFAGQTLANELENLVQHKFKVAIEALPNDTAWLSAYENVQQADVLAYKAYKDNDQEKPLPPPMEIQRPPIPPEIAQTFGSAEQTLQSVIGSWDNALRMMNAGTSGEAMKTGELSSNMSSMPYVVRFLQSLGWVAEIIVDLLPKYYRTPRTIPIQGVDGKRKFIQINSANSPSFMYDENALRVKVEAGVNFQVQKRQALNQMLGLMGASPRFAEFMNDTGLEVLLDNMDIRGIDRLKTMAADWMEEQKKMKAMQMQMAQQAQANNPAVIKAHAEMMNAQTKMTQAEQDAELKAAQMMIDAQKIEVQRDEMRLNQQNERDKHAIQLDAHQTQKLSTIADLAMSALDTHHRHHMDKVKHETNVKLGIHKAKAA